MSMPDTEELVGLKGIRKTFPGVVALADVDFSLGLGEVHALVGENGAGKSTLIKIISGVYQPEAGAIYVYGKQTVIGSPRQAQRLGISTIFQELNLVPEMTVAENIALGWLPSRPFLPGFVDMHAVRAHAQSILDRLQITVDVNRPVIELSPAQQRMVEIARALAVESRVLIIDEPTAGLSDRETVALFEVIETLRKQGIGIIYISHRLEEAKQIADRATVLRNGSKVATISIRETPIPELINLMIGHDLNEQFPKGTVAPGRELLRVEKLTRRGVFEDINFAVREGEIVGLFGLIGAGRTEVARAIFGADRIDEGMIYRLGQPVRFNAPSDAIACGIGLVPEERKEQGLLLSFSISKNITLPIIDSLNRFGFPSRTKEDGLTATYMARLRIKAQSGESVVEYLSGGNQQKVVLAKWLCSQAKLYIFDEPTRGIDVGAKVEVYHLMNELAQQGAGILLISSELSEIMGMSDRILVIARKHLVGTFERSEATEQQVLSAAFGHRGW